MNPSSNVIICMGI